MNSIWGFVSIGLLAACSSPDSGADNTGNTGGSGGKSGAPAGSGGKSGAPAGAWNGKIIQGRQVAIGPTALTLFSESETKVLPEVGTEDSSNWQAFLPDSIYEGSILAGATSARYQLSSTSDTLTFDLETVLDAASGPKVQTSVGPSWFTIWAQTPGASSFKLEVECSDWMPVRTGDSSVVLLVSTDNGTDDQKALCFAQASTNLGMDLSNPDGTEVIVATDDEGVAVFDTLGVKLLAGLKNAGDSAQGQATVRLRFVPQF